LFYQYIARILLPLVDTQSVVYALERASSDTTFDLGGFNLVNYVMMFGMSAISIYYIYIKKLEKSVPGFTFFFNIMNVFSLFILMNIRQSELSNRLFFYLWFFFPLVVPLVFKENKTKYWRTSLIAFFFVFFCYRLENGFWKYNSLLDLLISPTIFYLISPELLS
jgi:hypothetical protein